MSGWLTESEQSRRFAASAYPLGLIAFSAAAVIAVIWVATFARIEGERASSTAHNEREIANIARATAAIANVSLKRVDDFLAALAGEPANNASEFVRELAPGSEFAGLVVFAGRIEADGRISRAYGRDAPERISDEPLLESIRSTAPQDLILGRPGPIGRTPGPLFLVLRKLPDDRGSAAVFAALDPNYFYRLFDRVQLGKDSVVGLIGIADGIVRARAGDPNAIAGQNVSGSVLFELLKQRPEGHYTAPSKYDSIRRLFAYRQLADYPLVITVGMSEAVAYANWAERRKNHLLLAVLASLAIALGAAGWFYLLRVQRAWTREAAARAEQLRLLFEVNPLPMWVFDVETHVFLEVNRAATEHYGYRREEFLAMRIEDIRPPEELPRLQEYLARTPKHRGDAGTWQHCKRDGQIITVALTREEIEYRGRPARLIVVQDITDKLASEAEIARQAEKFRQIFQTLQVGYSETDFEDGRIRYVSPGFLNMFGASSLADFEKLKASDLYDNPAEREALKAALLRDGQVDNYPLTLRRFDGKPFYALNSDRLVRDENGRPQRIEGLLIDITALRETEIALRQSKDNLQAILDATLESLIMVGLDGKIMALNSTAARRLGGSAESLVGKALADRVPVSIAAQRRAWFTEVVQSGRALIREDERDGHIYLTHHYPVTDEHARVRALVLFALDITERRRSEALLAQSEARLRATLESMVVGVMEIGLDGRVRYVNPAACEVLELPRDRLLGAHYRHELGRLWRQVDASGEPVPPEALAFNLALTHRHILRQHDVGIRNAEGRIKWLNVSSTPLLNVSGEVDGALLSFEDVTEARQAEAAFRETSQLNQQIIASARDGIVVVNRELAYIAWNPAIEAVTGVPAKQMLGRKAGTLITAGRDVVLGAYERALRGETVTVRDLPYSFEASGRSGWASGRYGPLRNLQGEIIGVIGIITDVTERKRRESEIEEFNASLELRVKDRTAELEAVNRELESFSYSVSHDLRAPLRSIDGFSEILLTQFSSELDETARRFLQRVRANAQHMAVLIDHLLELARVSRAEVRRQPLDLSQLAQTVALALAAQDPAREVVWQIAPELTANADPQLLRIVLENLLGNAWKFTRDRKPARIEVGAVEVDGVPAFFVRDNGTGFDMSYSDKLFGAFQRLHRPEEFPGTGIGLASVKRIVAMHGGRVWAEGRPDAGASFFFTLG